MCCLLPSTIHHVRMFLLQFDWNVTRNENMADVSGLQIAYKAWRLLQEEETEDPRLPGLNLNTKQLFFLSAAQVNMHDDFTNRSSYAMNGTSPNLIGKCCTCYVAHWANIQILLFLSPKITWGYIFIYPFINLFAAYLQRCQYPIPFIINHGVLINLHLIILCANFFYLCHCLF